MFSSRIDAGRQLAQELVKRRISADLVLGIARGGIIVAKEIAEVLRVSLDVVVVKKLGAPNNPELAIGAITYDDVTYIDSELVKSMHISKEYIRQEVKLRHYEFLKRDELFRSNKKPLHVTDERVVLVDDGVATGSTLFAAIEWLKLRKAGHILLALPIAAISTAQRLRKLVDTCVILEEPENFGAVGEFYKDFRQVEDEEVVTLLEKKK